MSATRSTPNHDEGLPPIEADNFRQSLRWSVWVSELALNALEEPVSDLADEVRADPEYAQRIIAIYQMLYVDQSGFAVREHIARHIIERFRTALGLAGCLPAGHPLDTPIDYTQVPRSGGIDPDDINILRPDLKLFR